LTLITQTLLVLHHRQRRRIGLLIRASSSWSLFGAAGLTADRPTSASSSSCSSSRWRSRSLAGPLMGHPPLIAIYAIALGGCALAPTARPGLRLSRWCRKTRNNAVALNSAR
jgi:hypothetical protein